MILLLIIMTTVLLRKGTSTLSFHSIEEYKALHEFTPH